MKAWVPLKRVPAIDGGPQQTPSPAADPEPTTREPVSGQCLLFPDDDDVEQELTRMMDAIPIEQMPRNESVPTTAIDLEVPDVLPLKAQPVSKDGTDPNDDNGKALLKAGGIPEPIGEPRSPELANTSCSTLLDPPDSESTSPIHKETPLGISESGGAKDSVTKKSTVIPEWFLVSFNVFE